MIMLLTYSFRAKYKLKQNVKIHDSKSPCNIGALYLFVLKLGQCKSFLNLGLTAKDQTKWINDVEIILYLISLELNLYFGSVHMILRMEGSEK